MATYSNNNSEVICYGSEFKMNVSMTAVDSYHMGDVDFSCTFITAGGKVSITKADMIEINEDNYVAALSSKELGRGMISVKYECDIPDADFDDGLRHEVVVVNTGLTIE